jgi:hypothetical protein
MTTASATTTPLSEKEESVVNTDIDIGKLEKEFEAVSLELTTIRNARDKQRVQLEQLHQEHTVLQDQKELRQERHKLQQQLQDLQSTLATKVQQHQMFAVEDLEQTKSHHSQLTRTLQLMQNGVQEILERSAQDQNSSTEGKQRAQQRKKLLKELLQLDDDWKSKDVPLTIPEDHPDEDEDIDEDNGHPRMYHKKKTRYDSIESMVSEIIHVVNGDAVTRNSSSPGISPISSTATKTKTTNTNANEHPSRRSRSQSRSRSHSRSKSRSKSSHRSRSKSNRSRSKSRKSSRRTTPATPAAATTTTTSKKGGTDSEHQSQAHPVPRKTSLIKMLEAAAQEDDQSQDTPKTCNTRD